MLRHKKNSTAILFWRYVTATRSWRRRGRWLRNGPPAFRSGWPRPGAVYRRRGCLRPTPEQPEKFQEEPVPGWRGRSARSCGGSSRAAGRRTACCDRRRCSPGSGKAVRPARRLQALPRSAPAGRLHQSPGNYGRRSRNRAVPAATPASAATSAGISAARPQPVGPRPPSARAVTRGLLPHPDALPEVDRLQLKAVLANCPEPTALSGHMRSFGHMVTHLQGDRLTAWIDRSGHLHYRSAQPPALRPAPRTRHRRRHRRPHTALEPRVVEGHVNRIKMLKRQMFGRAGFELLRKRVLLAP
ncbi:hypothetical protein QFZ43_008777 [Streptomyces afghaniensis]|nr:hypothetical protein [Streptomyces afghaniensis]